MKKYTLICFMLFIGFGLMGCDVEDANPDDEVNVEELKAKLTASNWQLRSVEKDGYGVFAPESDTMYTINFLDNDSLLVKNECNYCTGVYEVSSSGTLILEIMGCTEMACNRYQHGVDFNADLSGDNSFDFADNQLLISLSGDEKESYTYVFSDAEDASPKEAIMADLKSFDRSDWPDGSYTINEADFAGDTLSLAVGYSGCSRHDFNLVFSNYFLESEPVQAYAFLAHKNEACRAYFEHNIEFDLTPLQEAYEEFYGGDTGIINITIFENGEDGSMISYTF